MKNLKHLHKIKEAVRAKYAWPGGYPLYLVCSDGEALSIDSARANWREIISANTGEYFDRSWRILGAEINWEDSSLYCAHSGERIESAYAEENEGV